MSADSSEQLKGGPLAAAISTMVVTVLAEHVGRGPTKARAYLHDELITVVVRDGLTVGELTLRDAGRPDTALASRAALHAALQDRLVEELEPLIEQRVVTVLSDQRLDPDVGVFCFVLGQEATTTRN